LNSSKYLSGVYAITDDDLLPDAILVASVEQALANGVSLVQYRSKQKNLSTRLKSASRLLECCSRYDIPLIINDDVDLASTIGAQGAHLGTKDADIATARNKLGPAAIIGRTCHDSIELAMQAQNAGADYVAFGRFYPSKTKPGARGADLQVLEQAKTVIQVPIVAIGGINAENGAALIKAGADMLAVIYALFGSGDIAKASRNLTSLFNPTSERN